MLKFSIYLLNKKYYIMKKNENNKNLRFFYFIFPLFIFIVLYFLRFIKLSELIFKYLIGILINNSKIISSILVFNICHLFIMALIFKFIESHNETIENIEKKNRIITSLISLFLSLLLLFILWKIYYIRIIDYFINFILKICYKCIFIINYFFNSTFSLKISKLIITKLKMRIRK